MSKQYTLSTFLRQTPNELLEEYFGEMDILEGVDFESLRAREVHPIMAALDELPDDIRAEIDQDFQDVHVLANPEGTVIIRDEAEFHGLDIADALEAMENHYERAMWLFLNREQNGVDLFDVCTSLAHLKRMTFTKAKKCRGLPSRKPAFDDVSLKRFADNLSAYYRQQGRGKKCIVEHCERPNPTRHCFFAFPEDYSTSELQYEGEKLKRRPRKSIFEIAFVYTPEDGTLELSAPGGTTEAKALQEVFCRSALRLPGLPDDTRVYQYNLDLLKDPDFEFPTNPEDGIDTVEVLSMRINPRNNARQRIFIEQDPTSKETLYTWIRRALNEKNVGMDRVTVSQVKMRVTWHPVNGSRPKTLTFTLTSPDSATLDDSPLHQSVKGYLRQWKIAP